MFVKYPWLRLNTVLKFLPEIERQNVSKVARSERGFLTHYRKYKYANAMKHMIVPNENITWDQKRNAFIDRVLPVYQKNPTYRRYLSLIAWAYDPIKK